MYIDIGESAKSGICKITVEEQQKMFDSFKEMLGRYELEWNALRAIMVATGAVISGSTALAVLLRGEFIPQDLDIYVDAKGFTAILVFLTNHGYQVTTTRPHYAQKTKYPESKNVLTLKRDGKGEKIDVIVAEAHVPTTITQFHSTVVMNYITSYGIICLYPEWTMRKNGLVTRKNMPHQILKKYQGRGFKMAHTSAELEKYDVNHNCGEHVCCPRMKRHLRDGLSLFIPFDNRDRAIDIREFEENENVNLQWMLKDAWECRKKF